MHDKRTEKRIDDSGRLRTIPDIAEHYKVSPQYVSNLIRRYPDDLEIVRLPSTGKGVRQHLRLSLRTFKALIRKLGGLFS